MSDAAKLPSRFWQFNLSSALLMMFASAGLLFLNMQKHVDVNFEPDSQLGWPWPLSSHCLTQSPLLIFLNITFSVATLFTVFAAVHWFNRLNFNRAASILFAASIGAMVWVNAIYVDTLPNYHIQHLYRGWPFVYYGSCTNADEGMVYFLTGYFLLNVIAALAIAAVATFACEGFIRLLKRLR